MATAAWEGRETADNWINKLAPQWPPRRQPGVDRSILRLAAWELTAGKTPPKIVIDEAIELAKSFSTEQSPAFVNGVLDALLKEYQQLTDQSG
jgi:N utilization substance protein B